MTSVAVILRNWEGAGLLPTSSIQFPGASRKGLPTRCLVSYPMSRLSASTGRLSGGNNKGILAGLDPQGGFAWASSSIAFLPSQPLSKPEALAFLKSPWAAQHLAVNSCGSLSSLTDRVWHFQLVSPSDIKNWK